MWDQAGRPAAADSPNADDVVLIAEDGSAIPRYYCIPPKRGMTGDILASATYAGVGAKNIDEVSAAAKIVHSLTKVIA